MRNLINIVSESFNPQMLMYHGTANDFDEFHSHRPIFFTSHRPYAEIYSDKGSGISRIIVAHLDIHHLFAGGTLDDVAFYNEGFIPWMKGKFPDMSRDLKEIGIGDHVPFIWADDFFVYLRRMSRSRESHYDGMIVDEGGTGEAVGGHGITVVPLWVQQIHVVAVGSER